MPRIIDLKDGIVVVSPECLLIDPFKTIWGSDKSKTKEGAMKIIKYIWFYTDFNSPYFQYTEENRSKAIITDVIKDKDFKVDKQIKEAIVKYKEINSSPAIEAVESAYALMNKINIYFKNVNLEEVDAKKVTDIMINMPKIVASLNEAKRTAESEETTVQRVRGGATVGLFENPQ